MIRTGPTAASIVDEAWAQQADLIILGANVRPRLQTVVIGSVADEVVRSAHCPVLLVRPQLDAAAPHPLRSFADDATRAGPLGADRSACGRSRSGESSGRSGEPTSSGQISGRPTAARATRSASSASEP